MTAPREVPPLKGQERTSAAPVSHSQLRIWFLDKLQDGRATVYNQATALRLRGALRLGALQRAIDALVARHETLRTRFAEGDVEPIQIIADAAHSPLSVEEARGLSADDQTALVQRLLTDEFSKPFSLAAAPAFRLRLIRLGSADHVLIKAMHQIASDGWSLGVWNRDIHQLYAAFAADRDHRPQPLAVQYQDFARWQRELVNSSWMSTGLAYWTRRLRGAPPLLALPADRPRPPVQRFEAGRHRIVVSAERLASVKRLCRAHRVTLYMVLVTVLAVVLARHSGQGDVMIGSPIANRRDESLHDLIGFFVNFIVLRLEVTPNATLAQLLLEMRGHVLDAFRYQDVPFDRVVEAVAPARRPDRTPLFQVLFALQNAPFVAPGYLGLEVESIERTCWKVSFDLEIRAFERSERLELTWFYRTDLFDDWRIEQLATHFLRLLDLFAANPAQRVGAISLLDPAERVRLLEPWSGLERKEKWA